MLLAPPRAWAEFAALEGSQSWYAGSKGNQGLMMRRELARLISCAILAGSVLGARDAASTPPARKKPAAEVAAQLPAGTLEKLRSGDEVTIKSALDDVRTVGKGAQSAAAPIADLLEHGLDDRAHRRGARHPRRRRGGVVVEVDRLVRPCTGT